ncbi:hypothetical protein [Acetivibrio cellulolyticus]|uniref:hypothetical protein n=1 Tax=Acetivibrio cellulolyticus TaxID=35830 RepID=UPI0038994526
MILLGEKDIFIEINRLLEDQGMDLRINDMDELTDFLEEYEADESEASEVYEEIRELYDQLLMGAGMW